MIDHLIRDDFKTVDKRDEVRSVFGFIAGETDDVPVVLDREKAYGILNEKSLMRSRISPTQKLQNYVIGTRTLPQDATLDEALDVIATSRIPYAPVTTGDRVIGVVHALDVLFEVDSDLKAEPLMTAAPVATTRSSVAEVVHHLSETSVGVVPVVDDAGRLTGVVRRRDVMRISTDARPSGRKAAAGEMIHPQDEPVEGYSSGRFETVRPDASFEEVRRALRRVGFAIVVDENEKPLGVVTPEGAATRVAGS